MQSVKQGSIEHHFWVSVWLDLGLNPGLLANTLTNMPMGIYSVSQKWIHPSHFCRYLSIYLHETTLTKWHFDTMKSSLSAVYITELIYFPLKITQNITIKSSGRSSKEAEYTLSVTSKCFLWKIGVGVLSALLQRLKRWGVSLLVFKPYAALYIKLVCMAVTSGGSLFWKRYTRKPVNSLLKTCQQSTWITGTMSYGLMRWRLICLVPMASSMCGCDRVRSTKISVSCLQLSMVVGMS